MRAILVEVKPPNYTFVTANKEVVTIKVSKELPVGTVGFLRQRRTAKGVCTYFSRAF